jgi:hypothetical protein
MAGFGTGGPRGRRYTAEHLCEYHPTLDCFGLHRAQALYTGAQSAWQWPQLSIGIYADASGITITDGEHEQRVVIKRAPMPSGGRRPVFVCECGHGCYRLYWKDARWACRLCHRLQHSVLHVHRWKSAGIERMLDAIEARARRITK